MEGLIFIAFILWIVNSVGKANKKKKPASAKRPQQPAAPAEVQPEPTVLQTTMLGDPLEPVQAMEPEPMIPEPMVPAAMTAPTAQRSGSLPGKSAEGVDPCHPREERPKAARRMEHRLRVRPEAQELYAQEDYEGLVPEITPENLRQAFVMSEILTRPCERRRYP